MNDQRLRILNEQTKSGNYYCDNCGKKITKFFDLKYKKFGKVLHTVDWPMMSLNNAYSKEDLEKWMSKLERQVAAVQLGFKFPEHPIYARLRELWKVYPDGVVKKSLYLCAECF